MYETSTHKILLREINKTIKTINKRIYHVYKENTILKTPFLSKMIYRFNAFPIKILADIFKCENQQDNFKCKSIRITKIILKKNKNQSIYKKSKQHKAK